MFDSPAFLAMISAAAIAFHALQNALWRQGILLATSSVFLLSLADTATALWPVIVRHSHRRSAAGLGVAGHVADIGLPVLAP
jgi:hypothetical protein